MTETKTEVIKLMPKEYTKAEANAFKHGFFLGAKSEKGELLQNALDLIIELVKDDPSTLCEVVDEHYPNWCENNCENFNRDCLIKYLKHYKKGE